MLDEPFVWWKHGTIYQVYPRSFQDSDADGVGDLGGVIRRLDYLCDLGVDAIWLSPFFRSPMADFGYDVSDHTAVDPLFGDLAAFDRLIAEAHARRLKVILDLIPNHTSDQHAWFQESRASRSSPRRDWYVWRDGRPDGGPPNNWRSEFGGPAWSRDEATGQFYYHAFLPSQPDLNWRNPAVSAAILDVMRFWLNRGADGFRVDAIHHLFEAESLADNPANPEWRPGEPQAEALLRLHTADQPEIHHAVNAMRRLVESYPGERVLIGEAYLPLERLMAYYGASLDGFHLPFNFHLLTTPWTPRAIGKLVEDYEAALPAGAWPNWVLGNHDRSRLASRVGRAQARVAAMLLLTLRGSPTLYQGDELGLLDTPIPSNRVRDPWELNVPGLGLGRDPVRTPIPWDGGRNAGFTTGEPWLPICPDASEHNAARLRADQGSILNLYRALLRLRRNEMALSRGDYQARAVTDQVLAYERRSGDCALLVLLNLTGRPAEAVIPNSQLLLSTHPRRGVEFPAGRLTLDPDEGVILHPSLTPPSIA